ncbi:MAG: hypothetical protein OXL96_27335 [Candidatus Poribacteria bacterium]|nr:hypothetical protein [Candidatus Poribacteria bacterium]
MRFNMTFAAVLVFFVPGFLVLTGTCLIFPEMRTSIVSIVKNHETAGTLLITAICFVSGVLIESLRLVTIEPLVSYIVEKWKKRKGLAIRSSDYVSKLTVDNLEVFTLLVDRTYEYYRLNANVTIVFSIFFLCYIIAVYRFGMPFRFVWIISILLAVVIAMIISCVTWYYAQKVTSEFAEAADAKTPKNQGDE